MMAINKKLARNVGMMVIIVLALLGITRACFFSKIQPKAYYLIAREISWYDFHVSGKEPNMQAFAEEIVLAASKESNLKVQFVAGDRRHLMEGLHDQKYDAAFTFMIPNSLNEESYYFSDPLYMLGSVLVVREDADVHNLQDMEGKIVAFDADSHSLFEMGYYPSMIFVSYENINRALNDLDNNKIDGVIMDTWNAHINTRGFYAGKLRVATYPLTKQGIRLITLVDDEMEDFINRFNDGLERIKASGQYLKLIRKWELFEFET